MTRPVVIIPARWGSGRFPGKALAQIMGAVTHNTEGTAAVGKPLVARTMEVAKAAGWESYVATDDIRIAEVVQGNGGKAIITSASHRNGTERVAEAARVLGLGPDQVVINLQGDACLTPPDWLYSLGHAMHFAPPGIKAATIIHPEVGDPGTPGEVAATCVYGPNGHHLAINFHRVAPGEARGSWFRHFGLYAYRNAALQEYAGWVRNADEIDRDLEQIRWLAYGFPLLGVEAPPGRMPVCEVNRPEDIPRVSAELQRWGIE